MALLRVARVGAEPGRPLLRYALLASAATVLIPAFGHADATPSPDSNLRLTGYLRASHLVRHADFDRLAFIQARNTLNLAAEWTWLERGRAFGRRLSWLQRSEIVVSWRGTYDSVYDLTPGMIERKDLQGDPLGAADVTLASIPKSRRDRMKLEGLLRDAYVDLEFRRLPLTLRIGKQQVVWGETDGVRILDRANTLDLSWHGFQELPPPAFAFDELRQSFFMVKGSWRFPSFGKMREPSLDFYWNPGDWRPDKVEFLPRPWGLRFLDPITNTAGTGALQTGPLCGDADCRRLLGGTRLFTRGDWERSPIDNSQLGVRLRFATPGNLDWSVVYYYQRLRLDGAPVASLRGLPSEGETFVRDTTFLPGDQPGFVPNEEYCQGLANSPDNVATPWGNNELCLEYFAPYIHTAGISASYFDPRFTQSVWRLETVIDFGLPFYDGDKQVAGYSRANNGPVLLPGITRRDMWKGALAFDRPTWIRSLNEQATFFITGQFFWHYIIDHERRRCAIDDNPANGYTSSPKENCGSDTELLLPGEQVGLIGPLDLSKNTQGEGVRNRDTIHQWEMLATVAMAGFYQHGTVVPAVMYLLDPVNSYSQEFIASLDWRFHADVSLNLTTRIFWAGAPWNAYAGHDSDDDVDRGEIFDPWFLAGGSRGRSETGLAITWQF